MHLICHSRRGRRRNHLWQIFWWSVEGCRFCGGSKIVIFHWLSQWPLTQGCLYRAACDSEDDSVMLWLCWCRSCILFAISLYFDWFCSEAVRPSEALDVANVIYSIVNYCPMNVITQLPADVVTEFFSYLSRLTCEFCRASADESVCCCSCDVLHFYADFAFCKSLNFYLYGSTVLLVSRVCFEATFSFLC